MSDRSKKAQKHAVEGKMYEMLEWYFENGGAPEPICCEDKKSYGGIILRWLEPPIVGKQNPVLVERCIGDVWTLAFVPMDGKLL